MNHASREAIIALLKGIFYQKDNEKAWDELVGNSYGSINDYFAVIGLEPVIDEVEGYAFLRQKVVEEEETVAKLITARELSYKVSLLSVLLRKRIADFDMQNESIRAVVSKEELLEELLLFMPHTFNEVKLHRELETVIKKVEELGFLKKLRGVEGAYEIRRAIKAFVDAQWLSEFDAKLQAYREAEKWN